ncbi:MAG TPA: hypothetical protein VGP07_06790 [Polyangia bacterium]
MSRNILLALVFSLLTASACSSGSSSPVDAAHDYLTFDVSFGDLPSGCPPAAANDKGIGSVCTMGGGECKNGLLCACEPHANILPPDGTPCVCTQLIFSGCDAVPTDYCGQGATCCSYLNEASICVPMVCLPDGVCPTFTTP